MRKYSQFFGKVAKPQGQQGSWMLIFSEQGKHREYAKNLQNILHGVFTSNTGKF